MSVNDEAANHEAANHEAAHQAPAASRPPRHVGVGVVVLASVFWLVLGLFAGGMLGAGAEQSVTAPQVAYWTSIAEKSAEHAAECRKQVELLVATQATWQQTVLAASRQDEPATMRHLDETSALISSFVALDPC